MNLLRTNFLILTCIASLQSTIVLSHMTQAQAFAILNIPSNSSEDAIKKAYKKLSLQFHPDKLIGQTDKIKEEGKERFEIIQKAYQFLTTKPDIGPSQEELNKQEQDAVLEAQRWVADHVNDFTDHEWINGERVKRNNKGLAAHIKKFLKSQDEQFNFPGPEGVWDYIVNENIAKIKTHLDKPQYWNKETIKQEILKLAEQIKAGLQDQNQKKQSDNQTKELALQSLELANLL